MKTAVVALGGNAVIKENESGDVHQQFSNVRSAMNKLVELFRRGYNFVLTHGNGPQVGNIMIRVESSLDKAYPISLGVAVAQTQGEMGYMISQVLKNQFRLANIEKQVVCVLTQVLVDKNDPQMINPSKPIGPFYREPKKIQSFIKFGMKGKEDSGRGWRRVVPSPIPVDIIEKDTIKALIKKNQIVIAAGGGGIPVYYDENNRLEGVDGVVDKDLASAVLAREIKAELFIILTAVDFVYLNFNSPEKKALRKLTVKQAKEYLAEDQFPAGSMKPKIEAAIQFLEGGGKRVIITDIDNLVRAIDGESGTHITN